jgi:hypothetical protein
MSAIPCRKILRHVKKITGMKGDSSQAKIKGISCRFSPASLLDVSAGY